MKKDFLKIIVETKKEEVKTAKRLTSETQMAQEASRSTAKRPFMENLARPGKYGANIIAEIKRASPSKGPIRLNLDPATYAEKYQKGGASAISVLTDESYFKGSLKDLVSAREATTLPVLRKDFTISAYQLYETAAAGADAALLIVRILEKNQLQDYVALCNELNLGALVEIHSEAEIEIATLAGARLIGINNRDLSSFDTNIGTAIRMASLLEPHQIPVAASGIRCREDIQNTKEAGIFNFLIGESLVRAENPETFLKSLF